MPAATSSDYDLFRDGGLRKPIPVSSFPGPRRGSQVVRQRSAKPPSDGSIPSGASYRRTPYVPERRSGILFGIDPSPPPGLICLDKYIL
jgi:hypothetical protein